MLRSVKAPDRTLSQNASNANTSLVLSDSFNLERSTDGLNLTVGFNTSAAANCKIGFFPLTQATPSTNTPQPCLGRSATKFSELLTGLSKGQLVTVVIKSWPANSDESTATISTVNEAPPTTDSSTINVVYADLVGQRMDITSINSSALASSLFTGTPAGSSGCVSGDNAAQSPIQSRKNLQFQTATSAGFINLVTNLIYPSILSGNFQTVQRQSTDWNFSIKSTLGVASLHFNRPTQLTAAHFTAASQADGSRDSLGDIDPPLPLKINSGSTLTVTWTLDGDPQNAFGVLTIEPSGSFTGLVCMAPAAAMTLTLPLDQIAKIPTGVRLWTTLRVDAWQSQDSLRWAARVSDWMSLGIQKN